MKRKGGMSTKSQTALIPADGRRSMYGGIVARLSQPGQGAPAVSTLTSKEIDAKCQLILAEIDRCKTSAEQYVESNVLHGVPQTFVPSELCVELELQLDRLLNEQILREERLLATTSSDSSSLHNSKSKLDDTRESRTRIEASPSNDPGVCSACNGRCKWRPFCDTNKLARRRKQLYSELKSAEKKSSKTIQSVVARSAMNGNDTVFIRKDLIQELSDEIQQIDSKLKLTQIDDELHQTYASKEESVSIRTIHGYDTTVKRGDALCALEFEHNRHIGQMVAVETIDNILEWMLEGWWFGERDTKGKGKNKLLQFSSFDQRGTLLDKASSVQIDSNRDPMRVANARNATKEDLHAVETTMKYGIFCLTFMYFRALHLLQKEKATLKDDLRRGPPLRRTEAEKITQEEKNALFRQKRLEYAMQKARVGEERKRQRLEKERLEKAKIREWNNRKKHNQQRLATTVQRVLRGHLGRNVARARALEKERERRTESLVNACATDIARVWRGYCGRLDAGYLRAEMAKFLFAIREEEARDEEEEYLATTNHLQRYVKIRRDKKG